MITRRSGASRVVSVIVNKVMLIFVSEIQLKSFLWTHPRLVWLSYRV